MNKRLKKVNYTKAQLDALYIRYGAKVVRARDDLLEFAELMMPHPEHPDDVQYSRYKRAKHIEDIAGVLQDVESGKLNRVCMSLPPRFGKSQLSSKMFPVWLMGRDPYAQIIFATYNQTFAEDTGRYVRDLITTNVVKQVFPSLEVDKSSRSAERIMTTEGGTMVCVGAGGALTGRGADYLVIDDIFKGDEDSNSALQRDRVWEWFWNVAYTRLMPGGKVVVIGTRWHEDDLIGRLTDTKNDYYRASEAKNWKVIKMPAILPDGSLLWEGRYSREHLEGIKLVNPRGFYALYQQEPSPEDGDYFRREHVKTYGVGDLPRNLRVYAASDHAVSTAQDRDATVCVVAGVDENDNVYVLDCWWDRKQTDDVVDAMLMLMQQHKPITWWAERGHISKSIGPFLRKRMQEEKTYIHLEEITPVKDKMTRARSIQARMSMGKVYFPRDAHWFASAQEEMLKFPHGRFDDFVDALAYIGMGLDRLVAPSVIRERKAKVIPIGTVAWMRETADREKRREERMRVRGAI